MPAELPLAALLFCAAMVFAGLFTALVRQYMLREGLGQKVREDGPQSHLQKEGTPTLGGVGIFAALALVTAGLAGVRGSELHPAILPALVLTVAYAAIGFWDDYSKLRFARSLGIKARVRVPLEVVLAVLYALALRQMGIFDDHAGPAQLIPFGTGIVWVLFVVFVIVGAGNAVNLTDGLDGLAGGVAMICALGLGAACWLQGDADLALWSVAIAGVCAGFLWLNTHPALIWMGDVGSLGLGAALAAVAVAARLEIFLGLFGLIFVIEALSVILQVGYFRFTGGKRILRMAPWHHHLELGGLKETQIVTRFWLITLACALVGAALVWLLLA